MNTNQTRTDKERSIVKEEEGSEREKANVRNVLFEIENEKEK